MKFKTMPLATSLCQGIGIEFGAATHNPFGLPNCRNIAPSDGKAWLVEQDLDDYRHYESEQGKLQQDAAKVDLVGDMQNIPVEDDSLDYVVSSHVVEHEPNPIKAFLSINCKLKDGGVAFFILPKRNQIHLDGIRPLTTEDEFIRYYLQDRTVLTAGMVHRTHYCVYSLQSFVGLACWCNRNLDLGWAIEAVEETDSKVGNGHTAVFRKSIALSEMGSKTSPMRAFQNAAALASRDDLDRAGLDLAITSLQISLSLDFKQPEALFLMAQLLYMKRQIPQSREFMQQALILEPEHGLYRKFYYETYGQIFTMPVV